MNFWSNPSGNTAHNRDRVYRSKLNFNSLLSVLILEWASVSREVQRIMRLYLYVLVFD